MPINIKHWLNTVNQDLALPVAKAQDLALAFDHNELLSLALERLTSKTRYTALPASLMPELFT